MSDPESKRVSEPGLTTHNVHPCCHLPFVRCMHAHPAKPYAKGDNGEHNENIGSRTSKVLPPSAQLNHSYTLSRATSITPNNQEQHNLNSKADAIGHQHNAIDCPIHAGESQSASISSCLRQQVLKGCWCKIEQRQPIVANVVGIVCPNFPARGLVLRVELVWRNRELVVGVLGGYCDRALLGVFW